MAFVADGICGCTVRRFGEEQGWGSPTETRAPLFLHYVSWLLMVAQTSKFRVPEMIDLPPFQTKWRWELLRSTANRQAT